MEKRLLPCKRTSYRKNKKGRSRVGLRSFFVNKEKDEKRKRN